MVHFIKKNLWFLETAYALLEGDELTDVERSQQQLDEGGKPEDRKPDHDSEPEREQEQVPAVSERVYEDEDEGSVPFVKVFNRGSAATHCEMLKLNA